MKNKCGRLSTTSIFKKELSFGQGQRSYGRRFKKKSLNEMTVRVEKTYIIIYSLSTTSLKYILIVDRSLDFEDIFDEVLAKLKALGRGRKLNVLGVCNSKISYHVKDAVRLHYTKRALKLYLSVTMAEKDVKFSIILRKFLKARKNLVVLALSYKLKEMFIYNPVFYKDFNFSVETALMNSRTLLGLVPPNILNKSASTASTTKLCVNMNMLSRSNIFLTKSAETSLQESGSTRMSLLDLAIQVIKHDTLPDRDPQPSENVERLR
eukprot:217618-Amphidinium_carterae.1